MRYQPGDLEKRMRNIRRAYAAQWGYPEMDILPPVFHEEIRRQLFQAQLDLETPD